MGKGQELAAFAPALVLLLAAVLINYLDRGTLALAAPLLKTEWGISAAQLGILFSAFFWTYTILQFGLGWLVDRFNVNTVMAGGFLIWSLSMAGSQLAVGFASLLTMRLMLGVGIGDVSGRLETLCAASARTLAGTGQRHDHGGHPLGFRHRHVRRRFVDRPLRLAQLIPVHRARQSSVDPGVAALEACPARHSGEAY
jgi:MFS family permease